MSKKIKVIAHRGASDLAPENTMAAFEKAKELKAQAIELDVHFSKDRHLVIHHEYGFGNPDNGKGLIFQTKMNEIRKIDAGSWMSKEFSNERIPELNEVLKRFGDGFEYEMELKATDFDFIKSVIETVRKFGLENYVEFTSPHIPVLAYLKTISKDIKTGVFYSKYPEWMEPILGNKLVLDNMNLLSANVAHLSKDIVSTNLVKALHKNGYLVHLADCNTIDELQKAKSLKIDQLSTNHLILAKKILYNE